MINTLSVHDIPILNPFGSSSSIASDIVLKCCVVILAYVRAYVYL